MQRHALLALRPWGDYQTIKDESTLLSTTSLSLDSKSISEIPKSISLLTNLQKLDLHSNKLTSLPSFLGQLTNLRELCVHDNPLTELPGCITKLRKLVHLQIECHGIVSIKQAPRGITSLPCWRNLDRKGAMTRTYADSLANLMLGAGEGCIDFDTFARNENSMHIHEADFSRSGWSQLSTRLRNYTNLCAINLSGNNFREFPSTLLEMTWLTRLDISDNKITRIPADITRLRDLDYLKISNSVAAGPMKLIPLDITTLPCWTSRTELHAFDLYVDISRKNLSDVEWFVEKWRGVASLDLSQNKLTELPQSMTSLTRLRHLDLSTNDLYNFPSILCKMTWLTSIDISKNKFTALPESVTGMINLERLKIDDRSGQVRVASGPRGLSALPCWKNDKVLQAIQLSDVPPSPSRPPPSPTQKPSSPSQKPVTPSSRTVIISMDGPERPIDEELLDMKLRFQLAPVVFSKDDEHDVNVDDNIAVASGLFCMLCFKIASDPCMLSCDHLFCSACLESSIGVALFRPPLACPVCLKPSITSDRVTSEMRGRACYLRERTIPRGKVPAIYGTEVDGGNKSMAGSAMSTNICKSVRERIRDATNPNAHKKCVRHELEIKYFCTYCTDNPLKCAECLAYDHRHKPKKNHDYSTLPRDHEELNTLLRSYMAKVKEKYEICSKNEAEIEKEIKSHHNSYAVAEKQREEYFLKLRRLVEDYDKNTKAQILNLYTEVNAELERKLKQVRGDKQRLEFAKGLVDWCNENAKEKQSLTEIQNALYLCGNFTAVPATPINLKPRQIEIKKAQDVLDRLELLNQQLMAGSDCASSYAPFHGRPPAVLEPSESYMISPLARTCVRDEENGVIIIKQADGEYVSLDTAISFHGYVHSLRSISVSMAGTLAVADIFRHCVLLYNTSDYSLGAIIRSYPDSQKEKLLKAPCCVAHDRFGQLYVVDAGNCRILSYSPTGTPTACEYLSRHIGDAKAKPISLCVDDKDDLLVVCAGSDVVLVFNNKLSLLKKVAINRIPISGHFAISSRRKGIFTITDMFLRTSIDYPYAEAMIEL